MLNSLSILPLNPPELREGFEDAVAKLLKRGLSREECVLKLGYDFDLWLDEGNPREKFPADLATILEKANWSSPEKQEKKATYASLIAKCSTKFAMSRREAAIILSQLPLILLLANHFRVSAAGIARLMSQTETRIPIGWRLVETILNHFGIRSELDKNAVSLLMQEDRRNSDQELGDSNVGTLVEILTNQAGNLGLDQEFKRGLQNLFLADSGFIPYFQILLFICTVDHFFDHPPEFIYTFRPRGGAADLVFEVFPTVLAPRGNPILNNFKAVDRITADWAESREDNREQARALVHIVKGMSSLAYSPRSQISTAIRHAIIRYIEIKSPIPIHVAEQPDFETIKQFVRSVALGHTGTGGVIEQRVADFLAAVEHAPPIWRNRGLGDPVNASNTSSKKLGDCDFQNIPERKCIAIEAHAGRLTDVYVREHLRTLRLNLRPRQEEWSRISDVGEWSLSLRFLVHEDARSGEGIPVPDVLAGEIEVLTYQQYFDQLLPAMESDRERTVRLFNRWVIAVLDASNTPITTKRKANELFAVQKD